MAERTPITYGPGAEIATPPAAGSSGERAFVPRGTVRFKWTGLLNGDNGVGIRCPGFPFKNAQFLGTFGSGGTIKLRGSNNSVTGLAASGDWIDLTDPQGNAISKTSAGSEAVEEHPMWIMPIVTAGDGATDLTCELVASKER